ncbi:MAG: serine hydrolase [Ruminiclostridium sp.]|nr:serine hydrolase [Ruminiclostridium sp.]
MKRSLKAAAAVFAAFAMTIGGSLPASAETSFYVRTLAGSVRVREGPGTGYKSLGRTNKAGSFTYIGSQLDEFDIPWYKISTKSGVVGWISSNYSRRYFKKDFKPEVPLPEEFVSDGTPRSDVQKVVHDTGVDTNAIAVQVAAIRGSDGKVIDWTYGWSKYGEKEVGNGTKFRTASISKVAVAICAMRMQEQEILNINKNISNYWGKKLAKSISLSTLFTHTSTLRYLSMQSSLENMLDQLTEKNSFTDQTVGKAASWYYNNYGISIAAATLEQAADRVLEDYAQEQLFEPLGVDMSFFAGDIENTGRLATLYEADHGVELTVNEAKRVNCDNEIGVNASNYVGGLTGSARDVAKMFYMLANDGKFKGKQVLSAESVEKMEKRYFKASDGGGEFRQCLALRYQRNICNTSELYYHTGNAYGVIAFASYDPATKNTVVVITTGASHERDDNGIYKVCTDIAGSVYENIDKI